MCALLSHLFISQSPRGSGLSLATPIRLGVRPAKVTIPKQMT